MDSGTQSAEAAGLTTQSVAAALDDGTDRRVAYRIAVARDWQQMADNCQSMPGSCGSVETQAFKSVNRVRGNDFLIEFAIKTNQVFGMVIQPRGQAALRQIVADQLLFPWRATGR
jgi:hypothetical protein